jgi:hypothetical protein
VTNNETNAEKDPKNDVPEAEDDSGVAHVYVNFVLMGFIH